MTGLQILDGDEFEVNGLAGLQYRIFFSHLLPLYAKLGVIGASAELMALNTDKRRIQAAESLSELYATEAYMLSLPIEV